MACCGVEQQHATTAIMAHVVSSTLWGTFILPSAPVKHSQTDCVDNACRLMLYLLHLVVAMTVLLCVSKP